VYVIHMFQYIEIHNNAQKNQYNMK
jgi:hypothetical protein